MRQKIFFIVALLTAFSVQAGNGSGKVKFLAVNWDSTLTYAIFSTDIHINNACSSPSNLGTWAFALSPEREKDMLALLLSAEARGIPIQVQGGGTCHFNGRENVNFIYIGTP